MHDFDDKPTAPRWNYQGFALSGATPSWYWCVGASEISHRLQRSISHGLLSSRDVAERLGVSPATVARAIARGLIQPAAVTPGGHRRFRPEDVAALQAAHASGWKRSGRLITSGEAARILGVSQHTVIRAVHHGRLVPDEITPGGHFRFALERIVGGLRNNGGSAA